MEKYQSFKLKLDKLDLLEFEVSNILKHKNKISDIADDIQRRIYKYGELEAANKIKKNTGAVDKEIALESRDNNFYDA